MRYGTNYGALRERRPPIGGRWRPPGGQRHTKSSYLEDVASRRLEYLAFEPMTPIAVRATPDLIVLRCIARIRLCVGIADEVEFRAWHTDHYERHDDRCQVMWSQATAIPE